MNLIACVRPNISAESFGVSTQHTYVQKVRLGDYRGELHYEFRIPSGQTINKDVKIANEEKPKLWANNCFLHHYNASCHTVISSSRLFAKNSTHILPQPPYMPNSALPGYLANSNGQCVDVGLTQLRR